MDTHIMGEDRWPLCGSTQRRFTVGWVGKRPADVCRRCALARIFHKRVSRSSLGVLGGAHDLLHAARAGRLRGR